MLVELQLQDKVTMVVQTILAVETLALAVAAVLVL